MTSPDLSAANVPEGFARHPRSSPLTEPWEPIYFRATPEAYILGLRLAKAHTNSRGLIHGGLIAALADNAMGLSCCVKGGFQGIVTVNLSVDFLGSAKIGQWLAFETDFVKIGGSICFAQCFVTADGEPCARANATFKIPSKKS
ncbi:PaaI family thioesterase [soil metagenome]